MKLKHFIPAILLSMVIALPVHAEDYSEYELGGIQGLACQAVLCLAASSSGRPSECAKAIKKFFSITASKPWKIFELRLDFLNLCPTKAPGLARAIAYGAGQCDAAALNRGNAIAMIEGGPTYTSLPPVCMDYFFHPYMTMHAESVPVYFPEHPIGTWVDPEDVATYHEIHQRKTALVDQCSRERGCVVQADPGCDAGLAYAGTCSLGGTNQNCVNRCWSDVGSGAYPSTNTTPWINP
jgi:hypothetical protein